MQNTSKTTRKKGKLLTALATLVLIVTLLLQSMTMTCLAVFEGLGLGSGPIIFGASNGISYLNHEEALAQLKKSFMQSINEDLVKKIEEKKLTGEVGVILTFSDNDLITRYSDSYADKMTYGEFQKSELAATLTTSLQANQRQVLNSLLARGLIKEVKYNYVHMLDGAYVRTTYEQIAELTKAVGVQRVTISNTYKAMAAVENPVNVYETGIFNSSDVSYTGKGTMVAVLDTGCDYSHSAFNSYAVQSPLYDRTYVESKLPDTKAYELSGGLEAREVYYGNITKEKIVFGYDYADQDPDIMPFNNNHGTHVAGIIAGKDDRITGVAVDAQLAIMKVFSDYKEGGEDGDILAALEDSIILQVDAINMSLGSSSGFTREADDQYKNDLYDRIEAAGISLLCAASNDYSSGMGGADSNTNKTDNPDSGTVGSPATYNAAMSVASINGNKDKYMMANGDHEVFFHESSNLGAKEYDFYDMLGVKEGQVVTFEYVTVPGYGMAINYAGLDVTGKIALVRRGDISFEEKVKYAHEAGALAVIIYNNINGDIIMTIGNNAKIPAISISKDDGDRMAAHKTGTLVFDFSNKAGPFMSDFSSWGPSPDLSLKPEITAHGGNILSAIPGGDYDELSGTSMACPNMCGITVLIRQYVKDKYPKMPSTEVRDLVNELCMSTATIALDKKGTPYSPRKQGAGIADIVKATTTGAYLYVENAAGKDTGKTKLELGDDPTRAGVYEMTVQLKNITNAPISYRLGNIAMTETVSSSDPEYVAETGYLLSNASEYYVNGNQVTDGTVTVAAGATVTVKAVLKLSAADKAYINANFKNGMYVEGFLTFDNIDANGVDLNAPFLAFYGDWAEAPIFDLDYYLVETEAHNNAIDDDDKIKADYYATTPTGTYFYDYILPLGSFPYKLDPSEYSGIPATEEKAAVSYYADCVSGIYGVLCGLLRGVKEMDISIVNTTTGEEVWSETQYNCYKSHYGGAPMPYYSDFKLEMANYKTGEVFGYNNEKFEVTMTATLDWNGETRNSNDTYTFSFYIDYQPPTVTDAIFRTEYDKSRKENRYYVDVMVYDNHYAMSMRPIVVYNYHNSTTNQDEKTYSTLSEYPIPVFQQNIGESSKVTMEITEYMDQIRGSAMSEGITLYIDDYAMNSSICYIPFPELQNTALDFDETKLTGGKLNMNINETMDLTTLMTYEGVEGAIEYEYLKNLTWESSNESVVAIHQGQVEAKAKGEATIRVTGDTWTYTQQQGGKPVKQQIYKELKIAVGETEVDNPKSSGKVSVKSLSFTSYKTEFAFNGDIDFSEIGKTGSTNFFGGKNSLSVYPSEKVKFSYTLEPWNLDSSRYEMKWSSSNPKVATVDSNGLVTALKEGGTRISLQIIVDGKTSLLSAYCSITVKSEFVIENRELIAYKGVGGDVVIPDDKGIVYIGAFAFSHYDLDNAKEVPKDEDGNYDFDEKKEPLGNDTITSVVIPDGVETIKKYAFYNCSKLSNVVLPDTCTVLEQKSFQYCRLLVNINMEHVQTVGDYAFSQCQSLTGDEDQPIDLSHVSAIGAYAFENTDLVEADLTNLGRGGVGSFMNCKSLTTVTLGEKTRLGDKMFAGSGLTGITVYADTVPDEAFKDCTKLKTVVLENDLTYLGQEAFSGCKALNSVTLNGTCEEIGFAAFYDCDKLATFTLPDCRVIVNEAAFSESGLKSLVFGENTVLELVAGGAFENVSGLIPNVSATDAYVFENGVLYNADKSVLVLAMPDAALNAFTVPASVRVIGNGAFSACNYLTAVSFANGSLLESIGDGAFAYAANLKSVTLPANSVKLGMGAFYQAKSLKTINLEKVTEVGSVAFQGTAITNAVLSADNVVIGEGAFYGQSHLQSVTLGDNAVIGDYAFSAEADDRGNIYTDLTTVTLLGDGVTVGEASFMMCIMLEDFDFSKLTGKVGDYAFFYCMSLTDVEMPYVTEIGAASFSGCSNLTSFDAAALEIVGEQAFAANAEDASDSVRFTSVSMPSLRVVGEYGFYGCVYLKSIDLSGVETLGEGAFAFCQNMESATLSAALTEIPEYGFYGCMALENLDLSHIERFGAESMLGVPLPTRLELPAATFIDAMAFVGLDEGNTVEVINAPNLTYVGEQAFAGCVVLTTFNAPKLEHVGYGAFAYTAIEEMEITAAMKTFEFAAFEGNTVFKAFYAMDNGNKVYDFASDSVMLKDGALYTVVKNGYVLVSYPAGKTNTEFTIADGTVRIDYAAVMGNEFLKKVVMPESMRSIGNFAFYGCKNLETVVFKSYYAPVLEGTVTGAGFSIKADDADQFEDCDHIIIVGDETTETFAFPGFEKLYKYDYYFAFGQEVGIPFYYSTFIDIVGSEAASELTYVLPDSCERYDSLIYSAYFKPSEETSGTPVGKYALAFIEAAKKLPEVVDRFDKKLVNAAINAYNALEKRPAELAMVDTALVQRFLQARVEYNVNVVENKIDHLFDLDRSEYSFELVKDARASFLALTDAEKALVTNAAKLDAKIAELTAVMGKQPDFDLTFDAHYPSADVPSEEPGEPTEPADDKGMKAWQIVLIVVGSVLVAGGIAVGVFFILKNRKNAVAEAEETAEENAPEAETAPEAEAAPEAETAPEAENAPETSASEAENEEERPKE